MSDDADI